MTKLPTFENALSTFLIIQNFVITGANESMLTFFALNTYTCTWKLNIF